MDAQFKCKTGLVLVLITIAFSSTNFAAGQSSTNYKIPWDVKGDEIVFVDGRLKLNGEWVDTSWWPGEKRLAVRHYKILSIQLSRYDNRVPKGNLIVMGDNTNKSFDSGDYGMIALSQLAGHVTPAVQ